MIGETPTSRTRLPVLKIDGGHDVEVIVRTSGVFGYHAHWLGRRSYMCPGTNCPACEQAVGARWHGLLGVDAVYPSDVGLRFALLEVTDNTFQQLQWTRLCLSATDFFGLRLIARRRTKRSPLRLETPSVGEEIVATRGKVAPEAIADAAATLFGLPPLIDGESLASWELRAKGAATILLGRALRSMSVDG